jgi:hypothetical protein
MPTRTDLFASAPPRPSPILPWTRAARPPLLRRLTALWLKSWAEAMEVYAVMGRWRWPTGWP